MLAVWIAEQPGDISLIWQGYLIEGPVSVLIGLIAALSVLLASVLWFLAVVLRSPVLIRKIRKENLRDQGYRSLTRGMVAVASGDSKAARKAAMATDKSLIERPLRLLLKAQSAQLDGDEIAARECFKEMLAEPASEFLGLRGLLVQSLREGDRETALTLVRRAFAINPRVDWVLNNLIDLETLSGDWKSAEQSVIAAQRANRIGLEGARRRRGLLLFKLAQETSMDGEKKRAANLAARALKLRPNFVPAAIFAAYLLTELGNLKQAKKVIFNIWKEQPHPELSSTLLAISEPLTVLDRIKVLKPLVELPIDNQEAHLAIAGASLDASMWGTAREHLGKAAQVDGDKRLYRLMARLEEGQNNNEAAARQWLLKASNARDEPSWQCTVCGENIDNWIFQCLSCDALDSFEWLSTAGGSGLPGSQDDNPSSKKI